MAGGGGARGVTQAGVLQVPSLECGVFVTTERVVTARAYTSVAANGLATYGTEAAEKSRDSSWKSGDRRPTVKPRFLDVSSTLDYF